MIKRIRLLLVCACAAGCIDAGAQTQYVKQLTFPPEATLQQKIDMAARLVPTPQQYAWQQMEMTCFLHFGINTFTGKEWGDGKEDPALFNPTQLNCEQWVKTLKEGGFKMAILTAKHHDGFCLWPTKTTRHSVASSMWRNGKGDVVRELRNACTKYGLKFGLYLSPWDRNAPCYGEGEAYDRFFIAQLTELLTDYGQVDEVWFDGANGEGPNGKKQTYDWDAIFSTVRKLQPQAVIAIMGDDVRWVGNEGGLGRTTEWSATALAPASQPGADEANKKLGIDQLSNDLGSRAIVAKTDRLFWYPSEVDVSIRPGWFYHQEEDSRVRTLNNLVDIYFQSVGCNSVLLLNIPPDRRGLLHETDVQRIAGLHRYLKATFANNALRTPWRPSSMQPGQSVECAVDLHRPFNTLLLGEDILQGQRVEAFKLEALIKGRYRTLCEGTTVGYKRMMRFPTTHTSQIRLTVKAARAQVNIDKLGLYYAAPLKAASTEAYSSDIDMRTTQVLDASQQAVVDGNVHTIWRADRLMPIVIDLKKTYPVKGFCYVPPAGNDKRGIIFQYQFYVSNDGEQWELCPSRGELSNIENNNVPTYVKFGKAFDARYVKLVPLRSTDGTECTAVAELGILITDPAIGL